MGLLSFLKRNTDAATEAPAAAAPDAVTAARTRARRRLIGAAVLLVIGVIGFPLLFETQPRPIPVNIPIEIPGKDVLPPLRLPAAAPAMPPAPAAVLSATETPAEIVEKAADQGKERSAPAPVSAAPAAKAAATKPESATAKPEAAAVKPAAPTKSADDGERARALLAGKASTAAPASHEAADRVVVQVGAYSEPAKLQDVRQKLEKLGFKTYTQVVELGGVKQTRVRVGPFANRAEADKVAARIRASGLPVAVYAL